MTDHDWYAVLQVAPDADAEVISAAFRALSKKFHPDRSGDESTLAQQQVIGEAYSILSDPQKRLAYDQKVQARAAAERARAKADAQPPRPASPVAYQQPASAPTADFVPVAYPPSGSTQSNAATVRQMQIDARERRQREAEAEQARWRAYHATQQQQAEQAAQRLARKTASDRRRNMAILAIGALLLLAAVAVVVRLTVLYSLK